MERHLSATYDPEVDAAYIWLADGEVDQTVDLESTALGKPFLVDLDAEGRVVGIEVLDASQHVHVATNAYALLTSRRT